MKVCTPLGTSPCGFKQYLDLCEESQLRGDVDASLRTSARHLYTSVEGGVQSLEEIDGSSNEDEDEGAFWEPGNFLPTGSDDSEDEDLLQTLETYITLLMNLVPTMERMLNQSVDAKSFIYPAETVSIAILPSSDKDIESVNPSEGVTIANNDLAARYTVTDGPLPVDLIAQFESLLNEKTVNELEDKSGVTSQGLFSTPTPNFKLIVL